MRRVLTIAALALAMSACGENTTEEPASTPTQEQSASESQGSEPSCQRASRRLLAAIETGLEVTGGGRLRRGYVVRSTDFDKVYMVAADIQGPGLEAAGDIGVWATNSRRGAGAIYAVNSVAQEFSDWRDADKTDAAIDPSAQGVDEARRCAAG
jgi:hypothetical protein